MLPKLWCSNNKRLGRYRCTKSLSIAPNIFASTPTQLAYAIMSMFGLGRPQPSSAEKIAAAEQEMDLITDMFNKYVSVVKLRLFYG